MTGPDDVIVDNYRGTAVPGRDMTGAQWEYLEARRYAEPSTAEEHSWLAERPDAAGLDLLSVHADYVQALLGPAWHADGVGRDLYILRQLPGSAGGDPSAIQIPEGPGGLHLEIAVHPDALLLTWWGKGVEVMGPGNVHTFLMVGEPDEGQSR